MILHLFFSYCYLIQYNNMTESEIKVPQKMYNSCLNLGKKVSRSRFEFREKSMYHVKWNWDEYQYQCHNVPPTRTKYRGAGRSKNLVGTIALSFYVTKTVLVGPKWFWSDQIDLDLTVMIWSRPKMKWSRPKWRSKLWFSTNHNHIWTWPIHFGHDHFILVVTKSLLSSPNQFGLTKTILDRPKLFWSHRRTRHKWLKISPPFLINRYRG